MNALTTLPATGERLRIVIDHDDAPGPDVVFVNGLGMPVDYLDPVVAMLPNLRCIRFDRPGISGSPTSDARGNELVDEIDRLWDVVDTCARPGRDLVLVGHSYGGMLADSAIRVQPGRAAGLVLLDTVDPTDYVTCPDDHDDPNPRLHAFARALVATRPAAAVVGPVTKWGNDFFLTAGPRYRFNRDARNVYRRPGHLHAIIDEDVRFNRHCGQAILTEHSRPFPPIPVHMLIATNKSRVTGKPRPGWVQKSTERAHQMYGPQATVSVVNSGHLMMMDAPHAVTEAINQLQTAANRSRTVVHVR